MFSVSSWDQLGSCRTKRELKVLGLGWLKKFRIWGGGAAVGFPFLLVFLLDGTRYVPNDMQ